MDHVKTEEQQSVQLCLCLCRALLSLLSMTKLGLAMLLCLGIFFKV